MSKKHPESPSPELRKHYYRDEYVAIAPARKKRPAASKLSATDLHHVSQKLVTTRPILQLPSGGKSWSVRVIPAESPAFHPENRLSRGVQEIVLETSDINQQFHELDIDHIANILHAYQKRLSHLQQEYGYVSIFKNHGARSGAQLPLSHSQIIATEIIPPEIKHDRELQAEYYDGHQTSALCDIIRWELKQNERVIAHTRHTTTLCPYASQHPLEAWIIPNRQSQSLVEMDEAEIRSIADHLKGVIYALSTSDVEYNFHIQEYVAGLNNHTYIKVTPRLDAHDGYQLNTGIAINPVSPEYATRWYQKYIKPPHNAR